MDAFFFNYNPKCIIFQLINKLLGNNKKILRSTTVVKQIVAGCLHFTDGYNNVGDN